jgi:HEAT repeat protein
MQKAKVGRKYEILAARVWVQNVWIQTDESQQAMRKITSDSSHQAAGATLPDRAGSPAWARPRTPADFKSILLELARAQRGFRFYGETDSRRRNLADRAHRAVMGEINRGGPIEFSVEEAGFRLQDSVTLIESTDALIGLEEAFSSHNLERLRLDAPLTSTALAALLDQLSHPGNRYSSAEHFVRVLVARDSQGLQINGLSNIGRTTRIHLSATPLHASVSLASQNSPSETSSSASSSDAVSDSDPKPTLDEAPLEAPASDDRGARLRARLVELHGTNDDAQYRARVADIALWAAEMWNDEAFDDYYRALLVLADHAVGSGGRSEIQARAAAASFASLANTDRLSDLIRRATLTTGPGGTHASVRAAQLLLQLGDATIPTLFDQLCREEDPERAAPLRALLFTQGDAALSHLVAAIEGQDVARAREAIRLAGELQNPTILPVLLKTLEVPDLARRIETIRALSYLPGGASKRALTEALTSDPEEIAAAASEALATSDGSESVPALLDVLEASLQSNRTKLGTTLIGVLAQLGDERAVPRLCSILERRPVMRRAHWHAIQIATVEALAVLPTKEARRSIERAALHASLPVRGRASALLKTTSISEMDARTATR